MTTSTLPCLAFIGADGFIASQLTDSLSAHCQVVHFANAVEAKQWVADASNVALVVTDAPMIQAVYQLVRADKQKQNVPILMIISPDNAEGTPNSALPYATDLMDITNMSGDWQDKINYYLDLSTRLATVYVSAPPTYYQFRLPLWKRSIDIAVSLSALLLLSPLLLIVALLIKLDSKGPILYKSARAGANFRIFNMYKFRTMKAMADRLIGDMKASNIYAKKIDSSDNSENEQDDRCNECQLLNSSCRQPLFDQSRVICEKRYLTDTEGAAKFMKFRNDPRITRLGTFLRNSSIDELPQLLNILLGDMSLVGNRPLPLYEAEKLTTDQSAQRFAGPAGLTGLWQVKKRAKGEGPVTDSERIALDIEYARTFSFRTDMYIIWQTLFSVWQKENV
ncbi:sugar transferase [uncultured Spirosoma sp.]|uniref:sugar transferase n=1 Tax=uncultured Spirosoma sp. TaxID=278208 RepID=UPI00258CFCAE|nr:sugar transferase [uncultured Spirosoma sp.]